MLKCQKSQKMLKNVKDYQKMLKNVRKCKKMLINVKKKCLKNDKKHLWYYMLTHNLRGHNFNFLVF